jgi:hypothetical protein
MQVINDYYVEATKFAYLKQKTPVWKFCDNKRQNNIQN